MLKKTVASDLYEAWKRKDTTLQQRATGQLEGAIFDFIYSSPGPSLN